MRIAPLSVPPHHSGPAARDFQSVLDSLNMFMFTVLIVITILCEHSLWNNRRDITR